MRRTLVALLLLGFSASLRAQDAPTEKVSPVKIPFTLMPTGHFLVLVKLNDKGPYNLIFDTGAPTMLINNRIAKDSGVLDKKTLRPLFSPFGAAGPVNIKEVQVGEVKADKIPAMIMDHPTVEAFSNAFKKEQGPIDGIVGFPFFARFKMTVDYQAKELTMTPNNYKPVDVIQSMTNMLMGGGNKGEPNVVSAAGQWGISVGKEKSDEEAGVTIKSVAKDSPSDKAGLKVGDRLLTIDGRWTDSIGDTYQAASYAKPGKTVPVVILREGKEMPLKITPASGL